MKAKLLHRKARALELMGDLAQAVEWTEKSLLEDNNYKVKQYLKKLKKGKKISDDLAYIDPEKAEEHRLKGNDLFKEHKFPAALKEYTEAEKRNPNEAKICANKAACYIKLMEPKFAEKECDKCLKMDPTYIKAYERKAKAFVMMSKLSDAIKTLEEALKVEPENVSV